MNVTARLQIPGTLRTCLGCTRGMGTLLGKYTRGPGFEDSARMKDYLSPLQTCMAIHPTEVTRSSFCTRVHDVPT